MKSTQKYPDELKQLEKQPDGRKEYDTSISRVVPCPDHPLTALKAATAVSHSDTLAIGMRPAFLHVAPYVVRTA